MPRIMPASSARQGSEFPSLRYPAARLYRPGTHSAHQAYQLLHIGFALIPIVAGLDKFFHFLTDWDHYLAPAVDQLIPGNAQSFMMAVGVIEIIAGLLVAFRPRIGGYVVAAWLVGIAINLVISGTFYDIALRDLGLAAGALALARLSRDYDSGAVRRMYDDA